MGAKELQDMLLQSGQIKKKTGYMFGRPSYGVAASVLCYMEEQFDVVKNAKGQEVVSRAFVIVDASVDVSEEDLFGYDGKEYPVIAVSNFMDVSDGTAGAIPHHKELYL